MIASQISFFSLNFIVHIKYVFFFLNIHLDLKKNRVNYKIDLKLNCKKRTLQ